MADAGETARLLVEDQGAVRVLTLANPAKRNAVDAGVLAALETALSQARADGVRCLVLRGEGGKAFSAGYDLTSLTEAAESGPLPDAPLTSALRAMEQPGPPIVAWVNGAAFGAGCELACACDLRVASSGATFGMPPARLGIIYAASGLARVTALTGVSRAKQLFFTGAPLDAATALQWGLVDRVAPPDQGLEETLHLAQSIAANSPRAVQGMRKIFTALAQPRLGEGELSALEEERRAAFRGADAREGRAAFLEKRAPKFEGK